jgi:hypothetical protein
VRLKHLKGTVVGFGFVHITHIQILHTAFKKNCGARSGGLHRMPYSPRKFRLIEYIAKCRYPDLNEDFAVGVYLSEAPSQVSGVKLL